MSIAFANQSFSASLGQSVSFSQLLTLSAGSSDPRYLVLNGYDRNEYTVASSASTASFSGNGHSLGFSAVGGDARGAGVVFMRDASGHYFNSSFGLLDQLSLTGSTSKGEVTALSLFGTNDAALATKDAANAISLAQHDASGYLGSLTVVTAPGGPVASQATPISIAAAAQRLVGSVANKDGCWVMASTIAAEAGASLPVQSAVNMAGAANGEWMLAYNGPAGSTSGSGGDWASSVRTGDMIGFVTTAGTGHLTTCVSGADSTAMVIDNAVFSNAQGAILNSASDGSANDIIVQGAHAASQEFAGVAASSVVIFRLDTPVVTIAAPTLTVAAGGTAALASVFAATDPAGKAVTQYQAYSANAADRFTVGGATTTATSAATAVTAVSLSQIVFDAGASSADTISVRASNGAFWGDWTTINTVSTPVGMPAGAPNSGTNSGTGNVSIYRFFDKTDGTHFFTASASEAATLETTRSDLSSEGVGLRGYDSAAATPSSVAVFRFFDTTDGTHFYTASAAERDALTSAPSSAMKFEGAAFYEDATPQAGDTAVYRFFDTAHGTHLFTQSVGERASILSTRPDLVSEGVAFYAPN